MSQRDPLERLVRGVHELERATGARVVIIGGVARGVWATPRATMDVDVLFDADLDLAVRCAPDAGLVAVPGEVQDLVRSGMTRLRLPDHRTGAVRMDVIAADHPFYVRVIDRSRTVDVMGARVRVACAEDIVLLKLLADRTQDRADVEAILGAQGASLDRALIQREAAEIELPLPESLRPQS